MGLFNRNKKKQETESLVQQNSQQPSERNEIGNAQLKEQLATMALKILKEGEEYEQLAYTTCEFGYLFTIEGHGLEALFKIVTDKGTYYFAAQKSSLLKLDFNETLFENTTNTFLGMHQ